MTAASDVRSSDAFKWDAHAHIDKFSASDERDAAFELFPHRARTLERLGLISKGEHGGLDRSPRMQLLHESSGLLHRLDELLLPHITGDMMLTLGADVIGTVDEHGNLLVNAGINRIGGLAFGAGTGQIYNSANSAIGAGDTNTAASASQTDLAAAVNAANRYVQLVDSQPAFASQVLTMVATFATGNGNFAWAEWAIGQNTSSGANAITAAMLNRKVASLGTKTSAAAWTFTVTITIS